jgi:hypothetical protein
MNFVFSNLRVYMSASQGMRASSGHSEFQNPKYGRTFVKVDSDEVVAVVAHMKSMIRACVSNKHRMYDGEKEGYRSIAHAHDHQVALSDLKHFLGGDFDELFVRRAEKVEDFLAKGFLLGVPEYELIWPELKVLNDAEALRLRELGDMPDPIAEEEKEFVAAHPMDDDQQDEPASSATDNEDNKHEHDKLDKDEQSEDEQDVDASRDFLGVEIERYSEGEDDDGVYDDDNCDSDEGAEHAFNYEPYPEPAVNQSAPRDNLQERNNYYFSLTGEEKQAEWNNHRNLHASNIVGGSRRRKKPKGRVAGMDN